jgi:hypothetical protein
MTSPEQAMAPKRRKDPLRELVRVLDKTTRVMQTMSSRIDVLAFGQHQCMRRIAVLERQAAREQARKRKAKR